MKGRSSDGKELKEQVASLGWEFLFSNPVSLLHPLMLNGGTSL